ncbi:MAG: NAD(P)-dependent oxidoreductase [Chloroflexi bacterium]|nr:NAD(P)-dependent oxidoreductase [Chloroflexota bacterium]
MADKRRVLVTGAAGYIASQLLPAFRERYDLVLLDVTKKDRDGTLVEGVETVNLHDPDMGEYRSYFQGVDSVVHLAWRRSGGVGQPRDLEDFYPEHANVHLAYNVYRASLESGVRRVVVASSNHAADWYEHNLIHDKKMEVVDPYQLPISDNFYGWAKATYEHLGFLFATGVFGRKLENVQVRIGAPREIRLEDFKPDDIRTYKRDLGAYISPRDLQQLFTRSIETESIENEHGIPWLVVYGISGNTRSFWSLSNARRVLGYEPEDDSEVKYAAEIQGFLYGQGAKAGPGKVGS